MKDCKDLSYQSKLKKNLLSLRARRIQHQLVTMYKIKNGLIDLHFEYFFKKNPFNKTRGNKYKLVIPKSKLRLHKYFFTNDCVKHWNRLKSSEIESRTCMSFKKSVLNYLERMNIW